VSRRGGRQTRRDGRDGSLLVTSAPVVTPATLPGLAFWVRSDLGVTYVQGPVVATGTSPPAVTFSGTPSSTSNSIVLTCTGAGTNTTATFSGTLNGVAMSPFTAAATVVLPGTGITATFPAGSYTNTPSADTYTSVVTVSAWADQSVGGNNATQASALSQFAYLPTGGPNSVPVMVGNAPNNTFMLAAIGTISKPCWVWIVCKFTGTTTSLYIIDGASVGNTLGFFQSGSTNSLSINSGTSLTWSSASANVFQAYGLTFGTSGSIYSNATSEMTGATGTNSSTGLSIGNSHGAGAAVSCQIAEIVVSTTPPAANFLSAYSQARYGFG